MMYWINFFINYIESHVYYEPFKSLESHENIALQNFNNIKNIVIFKFKEKLWCEKDLEAKRKLRYYKEVINPTLEDQMYLFVLTS